MSPITTMTRAMRKSSNRILGNCITQAICAVCRGSVFSPGTMVPKRLPSLASQTSPTTETWLLKPDLLSFLMVFGIKKPSGFYVCEGCHEPVVGVVQWCLGAWFLDFEIDGSYSVTMEPVTGPSD